MRGRDVFEKFFTADAASDGMASLYQDVLRGSRGRP